MAEEPPEDRVPGEPDDMPFLGHLITRGMTPRIPVGGLRISIGDDGGMKMSSVTLEVDLSMWPHWLEIAFPHLKEAGAAHTRLLEAHATKDDDALIKALTAEFAAAMQAIDACAFALDALYASLESQLLLPRDVHQMWARNRTSRAGRIADVIHRSARVSNERMRRIRLNLGSIFRLRNWAVHPPSKFREPVLYPQIQRGVAWQFAVYTAAQAHNVVVATLDAFLATLQKPRPILEAWSVSHLTILEAVLKDGGITYNFPDESSRDMDPGASGGGADDQPPTPD